MLQGEKYIVHTSRTKDDETAHRDGFDCGFLVPASLNPKVRDEQYGRYWAGMVLAVGPHGHTLYLTIHFIHKAYHSSDSMASDLVDEIRREILNFKTICKQRFRKNLGIVAGFDANVTFPPDINGFSSNAAA